MNLIQRIMQITGKNADEATEIARKAASGAREIDMGDIDDLKLKRGRPAKSPAIDPNEIDLGKTPRSKLDIDPSASGGTPSPLNEIDAGPIDDILDPQISAEVVGGKPPMAIDPSLLPDNPTSHLPPALRGNTLPEAVGPQVIGKGTSKAGQAAENIVDAEIINKVDPRFRKFLKPAAATAAGLGGLGLLMQGQEGAAEPQGKTADSIGPKGPQKILPDNYMDLAMAEANGMGGDPAAPKAVAEGDVDFKDLEAKFTANMDKLAADEAAGKFKSPEREPAAESEEEMYMRRLAQAQEADTNGVFHNQLLKAAIQAGAAIAGSGTKADYSVVDDLAKTAGGNSKKVQDMMAANADAKKLAKTRKDMEDEDKLRDHGSDISKTARELAKQFGINVTDKTSAKQLQDAGLPLGTLLSTKMAADARKEAAQLQREYMQGTKNDAKKLKVGQGIDRMVTQLHNSEDYKSYKAAEEAGAALQDAIASKDKTKGGNAFMMYAKIAQGDNSVVRDGDMAQLAGRYNYTSVPDMLTKLAAKAKGGNFNETEMQAMKDVAARVQGIKQQRVAELYSPIQTRMEAHDLDPAEFIDPAIGRKFGKGGITTTIGVRNLETGKVVQMDAKKAEALVKAKPEKYQASNVAKK